MLQDLDATLAALLHAELSVQNVAVSFAAPDDQFPPSGVTPPVLSFFLYDVRENRELRPGQWELDVVKGNGSAVGRYTLTPPPVRVTCSYLITAWPGSSSPNPPEGARTLASDTEGHGNDEWQYVSVRRLVNYLRKSLEAGMGWVVFEPNAEDLWAKIRRNVTGFLHGEWEAGALVGATPAQAFYVRCDEHTNPPETRQHGQVITEIGVAVVRPAEFVIFRISQWTGAGQGAVARDYRGPAAGSATAPGRPGAGCLPGGRVPAVPAGPASRGARVPRRRQPGRGRPAGARPSFGRST